jgi:hypothetical protein
VTDEATTPTAALGRDVGEAGEALAYSGEVGSNIPTLGIPPRHAAEVNEDMANVDYIENNAVGRRTYE